MIALHQSKNIFKWSPKLSYVARRHTASDIKKTCLYEFHQKRHARMVPFAGYSMPVVYKDQTIRQEHLQTRDSASVFDVSHMMQVIIHGNDRIRFIERLVVADVEGLRQNKCVLSMFTNESGGIVDDCIIAKKSDHLHIVSNAGNADTVWSWLQGHLSNEKHDVKLERLEGRGLIALQGPKAVQVLQPLVVEDLRDLEFMNTIDTQLEGIGDCYITRCGYTGEDGFEISIKPSSAEALMDLLCKDASVLPAGLGARDTLRLEAGLCLHGHDITQDTTPVEAALSWTIAKRRRANPTFIGSDVVMKQLKVGVPKKRVGLVAVDMGPPVREGCQVYDPSGETLLGTVTSGTFGPTLGKNIAMAYLTADYSKGVGRRVSCDIRGKHYEYQTAKMPFIPSNYYFKQA